ncbi:MAG: SpoIVB peptidase S55 [Terracidiphilus sp.]
MKTSLKEIRPSLAIRQFTLASQLALLLVPSLLAFLLVPSLLAAQSPNTTSGPPPSTGGFFPLSQVHRGMTATAWTVFSGTKPEPMQVEILGVLRGERGPGQDMILVQLHGAKPEYTGVVAGMSGSPVYIGDKLLGSLSYRIGQFSKDPIAGITPIEQMLEVRDLPINASPTPPTRNNASPLAIAPAAPAGAQFPQSNQSMDGMNFQAMETPLVMGGFQPEAIRLWQKQMAGTGLDMVAAGGMSGTSKSGTTENAPIPPSAWAGILPGSAVSAQLVRGDIEIAATCTVTYVDPKQLLACGHPVLQAGPVSLPMTTTDVVATLASPLNAFKIINTGDLIGAFTEDRESAIRGVFGAKARMIPVHISVYGPGPSPDSSPGPSIARKLNFEVLDLPSLTPNAVMVGLYEALLESNESTDEVSYHLTGTISLDGYPPSPLDQWSPAGGQLPAAMSTAFQAAQRFSQLYTNGTRQGDLRGVDIQIEAIPRHVQVELESARLISTNIVHAGDTVIVEATLHPWQQPARNVRIPVTLPARLGAGNLRLLVSDAGTLDRAMDPPRFSTHTANLESVLAQARKLHPEDRVYVALLVPETQVAVNGQTLSSLPLSMANALEPLRSAQDLNLNGESANLAGEIPAGGVLSGFQILNLHVEPGGGLD